MSKYDFEVNLDASTSTGLILNQIKPGSTVLEFGCATGRMTRYMKEALGCRVYIVELEENAYEQAIQYAEDGVCDDILHLTWRESFDGILFDAIIFADVLEHLTAPDVALREAAKLLQPEGNLFISIPNVTHNDVLLKELRGHFDYTKIGLLDDTHVHFWGYENLTTFADWSGLHIKKIEATYCETGMTEQFSEEALREDELLLNYFRKRTSGEIYQFVLTLCHECDDVQFSIREPSIRCHVYQNRGNGFSEKDVIGFDAIFTGNGRFHAKLVLEPDAGTSLLRFDPVEYQSCMLEKLSIRGKGGELPYSYEDAFLLDETILLAGTDPKIYIELPEPMDKVEIEADILLPGTEFLSKIENACLEGNETAEKFRAELASERGRLDEQLAERQKLERELEAATGMATESAHRLEIKDAEFKKLQTAIDQKEVQIQLLNDKLEHLEEDLRKQEDEQKHLMFAISTQKSKAANLQKLVDGQQKDLLHMDERSQQLQRLIYKKDECIIWYEKELDHLRWIVGRYERKLPIRMEHCAKRGVRKVWRFLWRHMSPNVQNFILKKVLHR